MSRSFQPDSEPPCPFDKMRSVSLEQMRWPWPRPGSRDRQRIRELERALAALIYDHGAGDCSEDGCPDCSWRAARDLLPNYEAVRQLWNDDADALESRRFPDEDSQ